MLLRIRVCSGGQLDRRRRGLEARGLALLSLAKLRWVPTSPAGRCHFAPPDQLPYGIEKQSVLPSLPSTGTAHSAGQLYPPSHRSLLSGLGECQYMMGGCTTSLQEPWMTPHYCHLLHHHHHLHHHHPHPHHHHHRCQVLACALSMESKIISGWETIASLRNHAQSLPPTGETTLPCHASQGLCFPL